jgi:D-3-phosphoglycerate dehydrogenase
MTNTEARTVLVTDYAWDSLDIERAILAEVGATLLAAPPGGDHELAELAREADAIMTCWRNVSATVLEAAERCQVVARYGVGLDNIDVQRAGDLGVLVTNVPTFCDDEVAEHAIALTLALTRNIVRFARQTAAGGWDNAAFGPMRRLRGQRIGIVGYGSLGRALASRARALGMGVIAYTRTPPADGGDDQQVTFAASLDELLAVADVVSLHLPLTPTTRGLIGARELALMKRGSFLINTGRGALIERDALIDALESGHLGGAGLDVLPTEPPDPDDPLLAFDQVIVTPHAAFFSAESTLELQRVAAGSIADVLAGRVPDHVVNSNVLASPTLRAVALRRPK